MSFPRKISGFILEYLLALPIGCVAALAWANLSPESYYQFAHPASFYVNDVGMVFFFALITKEVAEATIPGGALHPWRRAAMPIAAAIGAVAVSIAVYLIFVHNSGEHMLAAGWVAACAIDIPGSYVIARMIFGRHPAVPFLLLLAIAADAIGLIFVAVFSPSVMRIPPWASGSWCSRSVRRLRCVAAASRISGCTWRGRACCRGPRCFSAVYTPLSPSFPSCRSFRTGGAIKACSRIRRRRRTTR